MPKTCCQSEEVKEAGAPWPHAIPEIMSAIITALFCFCFFFKYAIGGRGCSPPIVGIWLFENF